MHKKLIMAVFLSYFLFVSPCKADDNDNRPEKNGRDTRKSKVLSQISIVYHNGNLIFNSTMQYEDFTLVITNHTTGEIIVQNISLSLGTTILPAELVSGNYTIELANEVYYTSATIIID